MDEAQALYNAWVAERDGTQQDCAESDAQPHTADGVLQELSRQLVDAQVAASAHLAEREQAVDERDKALADRDRIQAKTEAEMGLVMTERQRLKSQLEEAHEQNERLQQELQAEKAEALLLRQEFRELNTELSTSQRLCFQLQGDAAQKSSKGTKVRRTRKS